MINIWEDVLKVKNLTPIPANYRDHIKKHWLGDPASAAAAQQGSWWKEHQPIQKIIHFGFLQALKVAAAATPDLHIDMYWVCAGHSFEFDSLVCQQTGHLTLLMLTPSVPLSRRQADYDVTKKEEIYCTCGDASLKGEVDDANISTGTRDNAKGYGVKLVQYRQEG